MSEVLSALAIDEVTKSGQDPFSALNGLLNEYNVEHVGPSNQVPLWVFARDPAGKVQGGARGQTYWNWCAIDVLAVAKPYRRQGIGSRLLAKVEEIARLRGCRGIRLETGSFQAPEFYRRHGFTEFGRINDYPPGHTLLWLMKQF
jgi:ribosomal protein S18 acetylase RimI-like enzyme